MTASLIEPVTRTSRQASAQAARRTPWLLGADVVAITLFAAEGAHLAIAAGLDMIGVMTIASVSSLGGGIVRDVLCRATPPAALCSVTYPVTALLGGLVAVVGHQLLTPVPYGVRAPLDAAALGLFCVVGTIKALDLRMRPLAAVLLGATSAVGGGVIRDVLLGVVPAALRTDMCAVAAASGAAVTVVALRCGASRGIAAGLGVGSCAAVALVSAAQGWQLPPVGGQSG